jgi:phosphoribosyl-ATP pyrophosphohydrolase/phosphoribosyl-AMP cyclohydrolase/histidinol dehydrogenase
MSSAPLFPRRTPAYLTAISNAPIDQATLATARRIIDRVERESESAIDTLSIEFGEREQGAPVFLDQASLAKALDQLPAEQRTRLERTAQRIARFAEKQLAMFTDIASDVPGGRAGHSVFPVSAAGCYAPGGRYPLPSSVLMTAVTARTAGVANVWVASPRPTALTLAAASVAGADGLLSAGGAHAIAALSFGLGPIPRCDVVVGPGNKYVTAAKQLLFGRVQIDMLAGPSELVVLADESADPAVVAADLLAQAEHDPDALPILITTSESLAPAVERELDHQLADLPTATVSRAALQRGGFTVVPETKRAIDLCNAIAPEHLEVMLDDMTAWRSEFTNYGAAFFGAVSAEVFGDYGVGPNHVLPTGGTARSFSGLSVLTFLRVRTWLQLDSLDGQDELMEDVTWLARAEGLEAHARAAEIRAG